jgi:hypothetical protein
MKHVDYNDHEDRQVLRIQQKRARYFIKLHRRLMKPPYPVKIMCPACGHPFIRVNSDLIEIVNNAGLLESELTAQDAWSEQKHGCGAKITLYWKA